MSIQATQTVTWDGKDFSVIQRACFRVQRVYGRPCYEIDKDWNLKINGEPVEVGSSVRVEDGRVTVTPPGGPA